MTHVATLFDHPVDGCDVGITVTVHGAELSMLADHVEAVDDYAVYDNARLR